MFQISQSKGLVKATTLLFIKWYLELSGIIIENVDVRKWVIVTVCVQSINWSEKN